jgi:hypothetical protein
MWPVFILCCLIYGSNSNGFSNSAIDINLKVQPLVLPVDSVQNESETEIDLPSNILREIDNIISLCNKEEVYNDSNLRHNSAFVKLKGLFRSKP